MAIQTLAAKVLQLDLALADYGPDADAGRALLRQDFARTISEVWGKGEGDKAFAAGDFSEALANMKRRQAYLNSLTPATDNQRMALAAAQATVEAIAQSRMQMSFALSSPISWPLVLLVVAWAVPSTAASASCPGRASCPWSFSSSARSRSAAPPT